MLTCTQWFKNVPKFFNSSKDHWPKHVASLGDLRTECVVAYIIALMGYTMTKYVHCPPASHTSVLTCIPRGRQCSRCNSDDRVLDRCYTLPAMNTKEGIYLASVQTLTAFPCIVLTCTQLCQLLVGEKAP